MHARQTFEAMLQLSLASCSEVFLQCVKRYWMVIGIDLSWILVKNAVFWLWTPLSWETTCCFTFFSHITCTMNHIFKKFTYHATKTRNLMSPNAISVVQKCFKIRFQPGLCPGPHWGSSDHSFRSHQARQNGGVGEVSRGPATFRGSAVDEKIKRIVCPFH